MGDNTKIEYINEQKLNKNSKNDHRGHGVTRSFFLTTEDTDFF